MRKDAHQEEDAAKMEISKITPENYHQVVQIYEEGLATGVATFETEAPPWNTWDASHLEFGRITAIDGSIMLGWASMSPVSSRYVYGGVAEVSVYVSAEARGEGVGQLLLNSHIISSEENGIWTLQSGIFKENLASIVLHKQCGFRIIGYREKIGNLNGVWKDNVLLERRSKTVGI